MQNRMGMGGCAVAALLFCVAAVAAERPDFTGVWTNAGRPGIGGATRAAPAEAPALTPVGKARIDAYQKLTVGTDDSPYAWCAGLGMPSSMLSSGGYPMEILQRPEEMVIVYEAMTEIRRVYFGDRNIAEADRVPGRNGYSSGHWEGDTLVVETDNLDDQVDQRGTAHSDQARIVERYHLEGKDAQGRRILAVEMTMTDPVFYTKPLVREKRWAEMPNGHSLPYECTEAKWLDRIEEMAQKAGVPVP